MLEGDMKIKSRANRFTGWGGGYLRVGGTAKSGVGGTIQKDRSQWPGHPSPGAGF